MEWIPPPKSRQNETSHRLLANDCRSVDALCETTRPIVDGAGLRKAGRRNPNLHRSPQPLYRSWHTCHQARRLSQSGKRGSMSFNRFVHVWMPPLVQEISERFECVIGCGHVSGLSLQRLIQPRAGMAMREPKADQQIELIGSCTKTALSGPDLSDHFPLLFIDLLTHSSPGARYTAHCAHAIVATGVR